MNKDFITDESLQEDSIIKDVIVYNVPEYRPINTAPINEYIQVRYTDSHGYEHEAVAVYNHGFLYEDVADNVMSPAKDGWYHVDGSELKNTPTMWKRTILL